MNTRSISDLLLSQSGPVSAPNPPEPPPENPVKCPDLGVPGNRQIIARIAKIPDYIAQK